MSVEPLAPLIPYQTYDEYNTLKAGLITEYKEMIKEGLDIVKKRLRYWSSTGQLSGGVYQHWGGEGAILWFKLTKGIDLQWCKLQSLYLVHELDRVSNLVFQFTERHASNQLVYDSLLHHLYETIEQFVDPLNDPSHMSCLEDTNFDWSDEGEVFPKQLACDIKRGEDVRPHTSDEAALLMVQAGVPALEHDAGDPGATVGARGTGLRPVLDLRGGRVPSGAARVAAGVGV